MVAQPRKGKIFHLGYAEHSFVLLAAVKGGFGVCSVCAKTTDDEEVVALLPQEGQTCPMVFLQ